MANGVSSSHELSTLIKQHDLSRKSRKQETLREKGTVSSGLGLWASLQNSDIFNQGHMAPLPGSECFYAHMLEVNPQCSGIKKREFGGSDWVMRFLYPHGWYYRYYDRGRGACCLLPLEAPALSCLFFILPFILQLTALIRLFV